MSTVAMSTVAMSMLLMMTPPFSPGPRRVRRVATVQPLDHVRTAALYRGYAARVREGDRPVAPSHPRDPATAGVFSREGRTSARTGRRRRHQEQRLRPARV